MRADTAQAERSDWEASAIRSGAPPPCVSNDSTIPIAIELSTSLWLVATRLPGVRQEQDAPHRRWRHRGSAGPGQRPACATLDGPGQVAELACCFEAGRDGFWLHRLLTRHGVPTYVVEPTSILVNRRARRAKTDRLDAEGLLRVLAAYVGGDRQICRMVRVPTPEEEDAKRPHREREHLVQERTRFEDRIQALLATQGIRERSSLRTWERDLAALQTGDGRAMPHHLLAERHRLRRRLVLTMELIREADAERAKAFEKSPHEAASQKVTALRRIRGIGDNVAAVLVREVLYGHSVVASSWPATLA